MQLTSYLKMIKYNFRNLESTNEQDTYRTFNVLPVKDTWLLIKNKFMGQEVPNAIFNGFIRKYWPKIKTVNEILQIKEDEINFIENKIKSEYNIQKQLINVYNNELQFRIIECGFNNLIIRVNYPKENNFIDLKKFLIYIH